MASRFDNTRGPNSEVAEIPAAAGLAVLLLGAALGVAAGLLLAPKSGRDLRAELLSQAGEWKNHAADALAQGRENLVSVVESTQKPPA